MKTRSTTMKMTRGPALLLGMVTFLVATLLAACGSSGGGAASSSVIPIGNIGTYSGSNSTDFASGGPTLRAWAQWTNAHGGINGEQVKLYQLDDGGSSSQALTDAKQLVQQDHVVAIVGEMDTAAPVWANYVEQAGIPVVGGNPSDPLFFENSNFYPDAATANSSFATVVKASGPASSKGGFFYCTENPACSELQPILKASYASAGGQVVNDSPISSSSPNFTAQCLAAKSAGAQSVYVAVPAQTILTIADNCAQQHYNPYLLTDLLAVTPTVAGQLSKVQGIQMLANSDDVPFFDTSSAAIQTFQAALKQYDPSVLDPSTLTENAVSAWAAGQLLISAVKASGGKSVTAASIKNGLYALPKDSTVGGLTPPLSYVRGKPADISCIYVAGVTGQGLTMPKGQQAFC